MVAEFYLELIDDDFGEDDKPDILEHKFASWSAHIDHIVIISVAVAFLLLGGSPQHLQVWLRGLEALLLHNCAQLVEDGGLIGRIPERKNTHSLYLPQFGWTEQATVEIMYSTTNKT